MNGYLLDLGSARVREVLRAFGTPYVYGAGAPKDGVSGAWPRGARTVVEGRSGIGWDCSGFVQAALVRVAMLSAAAPDRTAAGLYDSSVDIGPREPLFGDLAFYGVRDISHVTLCLGGGLCLGANGGGRETDGDNPAAFVRIDRIEYRPDFRGVRRLVGLAA